MLHRHSALAGCKRQPFELPVLTCFKHAALRVSKAHHLRLAIIRIPIQPEALAEGRLAAGGQGT